MSKRTKKNRREHSSDVVTRRTRKGECNMRRPKRIIDVADADTVAQLKDAWGSCEATPESSPLLPAGEYLALAVHGELMKAKTGTAGYRIVFRVTEGDYVRRTFKHHLWLTENAMWITKRDLEKLGLTQLEQLEEPLPSGLVCKVKLSTNCPEGGTKYNYVEDFTVMDPEEGQCELATSNGCTTSPLYI